MTTPTSGVIGSLCVVVLLNTVLIHFGTVCFYKDAPAITALQQEAIMSPDMIVDAGVISCGITACGAVSKSGGLSTYVMGAGQALELLNPIIQSFYVNAEGLVSHQLPDVISMVVEVAPFR